jgi:hypothetical protein
MNRPPEYNLGMRSAASAEAGRSVWLFAKPALSKIEPRAVLYRSAGDKAVLLTVYGVESEKAQMKLVKLIELEQERQGWRPIYIEFRRREVWVQKPNGVRERGDEEILRVRKLGRSR